MLLDNDSDLAPVAVIDIKDLNAFVSKIKNVNTDALKWLFLDTSAKQLKPSDILFCETEAKATNYCWDNIGRNRDLIAIPISAFSLALKRYSENLSRTVDYPNENKLSVPNDQISDHNNSPKAKNYVDLQMQLQALQFSDEITKYELLANMQENDKDFELKFSFNSSRHDKINYVLYFIQQENETYSLSGYEGTLRRAIKMPTSEASNLEQKMKAIDWPILLYGHKTGEPFLLQVQQIKNELEILSSSGVYGHEAAENLKFRYWQGTVLEKDVENSKYQESLYQSSYLFNGNSLSLGAQDGYSFLALKLAARIERYKELISTSFINTKNTFMNTDNVEFLQDNMKYLGFGEKLQLNKQLEDQIGKEPKEFQLRTQAIFGESEKMDAVLHFRRSDQSGLYFFNKYDAQLKDQLNPSNNDRSQTFYINKGSGVTLKEAFNLLQGRAVNKDLTNADNQKYNAWMKLDFSEKDHHGNNKVNKYTPNYGYNLERKLAKLPIEEANPSHPKYAATVRSLKKGDLVEVHSSTGEKQFISANPPAGKVELFDANKNSIEPKREYRQTEGVGKGKENAQSNQNGRQKADEVSQDNGTRSKIKKEKVTQEGEATPTRRKSRGR